MITLRHLSSFVLAALGVGLMLHCGGQVSAAPSCPAQLTGACTSGDLCAEAVSNDCGITVTVDCRCGSNDRWACDAPAACKPDPQCTSSFVAPGESCTAKGLTCAAQVACAQGGGGGPGVQNDCVCDGTTWQCPTIDCPPPPTNPCPSPGTLHGGEFCVQQGAGGNRTCESGQPILGCDAGVQGYETCTCEPSGTAQRWQCASVGPPNCPVDGGGFDAGFADAGSSDGGSADQ